METNTNIGLRGLFSLAVNVVGRGLNVVDTATAGIETTVLTANNVINQGSKAIDLVTTGALADLETDSVIDAAHRQVRQAQAQAEAQAILDTLPTMPKPKRTAKAK